MGTCPGASTWERYETNLLKMDFRLFINLTLILLKDNTAKGVAEEELPPFEFEQKGVIYFQLKRTEIEHRDVINNDYDNGRKMLLEFQLERISKQREELGIVLQKDINQVQQKIGDVMSSLNTDNTVEATFQELKEMLISLEERVENLTIDFQTMLGKILEEIKRLNEELKEELNKPSLTKDLRSAAIGEVLGFVVKILLPQLN
ncbi:hypothetical protein AA0X95_20305 [Bacillus sp. 1P10SD]|uniref:hypothetical protein n=1 Tax=Bacillus sp. 1P10SD TaxID=3132265 RepID=UPI0039A616ED